MTNVPTIALDPMGHDHQGEAARLRAAGPVVDVVLPGDLRAYALTTHALVRDLVRDERVSKDWRDWNAAATPSWLRGRSIGRTGAVLTARAR